MLMLFQQQLEHVDVIRHCSVCKYHVRALGATSNAANSFCTLRGVCLLLHVQAHMLPDQHGVVNEIKEIGLLALSDVTTAVTKVRLVVTCRSNYAAVTRKCSMRWDKSTCRCML